MRKVRKSRPATFARTFGRSWTTHRNQVSSPRARITAVGCLGNNCSIFPEQTNVFPSIFIFVVAIHSTKTIAVTTGYKGQHLTRATNLVPKTTYQLAQPRGASRKKFPYNFWKSCTRIAIEKGCGGVGITGRIS